MSQYYSCTKHMVEGYGRTVCKYCEDKEYDYKPYEEISSGLHIVDGSRQIKTPKQENKQ